MYACFVQFPNPKDAHATKHLFFNILPQPFFKSLYLSFVKYLYSWCLREPNLSAKRPCSVACWRIQKTRDWRLDQICRLIRQLSLLWPIPSPCGDRAFYCCLAVVVDQLKLPFFTIFTLQYALYFVITAFYILGIADDHCVCIFAICLYSSKLNSPHVFPNQVSFFDIPC